MAHDGCCVQFQCCKIITLHIQANNKHCFSLDSTLLLHALHLDYLELQGEGEGSGLQWLALAPVAHWVNSLTSALYTFA